MNSLNNDYEPRGRHADNGPDYTKRRLGVAGLVAVTALGIFGARAAADKLNEPEDPNSISYIVKDPKNIPEGHSIEIPATDGMGPISIAQEYGSEGHIEDLTAQLQAQVDEDGNLPAGMYTVYDKLVDPEYIDQISE